MSSILYVAAQELDVEGIIRAQNIQLEGPIKLGDTFETPLPGTIRFNHLTHDFEGFNGIDWYSITGIHYELSTVEDHNGNIYNTVKIGDQEWMTQNFRGTFYNDGTTIEKVIADGDWSSTTSGAWSWFNNDFNVDLVYGKLYNFFAVQTGKLCPLGWHVPSEGEWLILRDYLDVAEFDNYDTVSERLRERGITHWASPNDATNESGFTAIPAGLRLQSGSYSYGNTRAFFWTSTPDPFPNVQLYRHLIVEIEPVVNSITNGGSFPNVGLSVRCLKDQ